MYQVKKRFTDGPLNGMTVTEMTGVPMEMGQVIMRSSYAGSSYEIISVRKLY